MATHPSVQTALVKPLAAATSVALPAAAKALPAEVGGAVTPGRVLSSISDIARNQPEALGQWAAYFRPDASDDDRAVTDYTLAQTDPAYQRHRRELAERMERGEQ
jgi:hypothetical protein